MVLSLFFFIGVNGCVFDYFVISDVVRHHWANGAPPSSNSAAPAIGPHPCLVPAESLHTCYCTAEQGHRTRKYTRSRHELLRFVIFFTQFFQEYCFDFYKPFTNKTEKLT